MSVWVPVNDEFTIFEREELFVASVVRKDKKSKTLKENTVGMMIRFSGRDCLPRRAEKKKEEIETGDLFFSLLHARRSSYYARAAQQPRVFPRII